MLGSDLSIVIQRQEQILCFGYKYSHDIPHDLILSTYYSGREHGGDIHICYHKYPMERRRVASEPCWRLD